ncbi:hypothetical protein [Labrys monachus]|uniref:Uncharacterized protein n=1 Tax=Labrys monachus TaxID=217067 RepID=A0ABU0FP91_9HYPH|nr:hypothetical protein [Labrys monachus]MDQ0396432.1 hypothetical protein [Labrys monachus]
MAIRQSEKPRSTRGAAAIGEAVLLAIFTPAGQLPGEGLAVRAIAGG